MTKTLKITLVLFCFGISIYCFMIKLPISLRKIDTELHALFYFSAAAFLSILFNVKKINTHLLIFGMLFLFSTLIEFAQAYSNKLLGKKIHGNFDPEDLKYNLLGLFCFSIIWLIYLMFLKTRRSSANQELN